MQMALLMVGLPVVLFASVMTFLKSRSLPYFVFVGLVIGQLIRLSLSQESSSSLLVIDILNGFYVAVAAIYAVVQRKRFPVNLSLILLGSFCAWLFISLMLGAYSLTAKELLIAFSYAVRFLLMAGTLVVTVWLFPQEEEQQRWNRALLGSGLVLTLLGYIQLLVFPNFGFMAQFGWDPHVGRLLSTFFDPNFFSFFLTIMFCLLLSRFFYAARPGSHFVYFVLLGLVGAAMVLTFSRSGYLAFLISVFMILLFRAWRLLVVAIVIVAIITVSVPRLRDRIVSGLMVDTTAQDRIQSWKETVYIVAQNPVTGVGYNAFGPALVKYGIRQNLQSHASQGSDSSLLLILATTGVVGLGLFLSFMLALWCNALLVFRFSRRPYFQASALALIGLIPGYLVHSQFVNSLFYPLIFIPFCFLASNLLVGLEQLPKDKQS
jgi:O-antigen ligase